jgi:hypothetical protein
MRPGIGAQRCTDKRVGHRRWSTKRFGREAWTGTPPFPTLPVHAEDCHRRARSRRGGQDDGRAQADDRSVLRSACSCTAVLAGVPLDAAPGAVLDAAGSEGRSLGATGEDIAAAAEVASRVLAHDLMVRAHRAFIRGSCRREAPVTLSRPDGALVEGIVDLAFEEDDRWIVVDYKTDRENRRRRRNEVQAPGGALCVGHCPGDGPAASGVIVRI